MLKSLRERISREEGFTLIELMVVVLIIAVLVAIAIPSFLGFRTSAQDRSAQTVLRNGVLSQKGYWTDNQGYASTEAALQTFETTIRVGTNPGELEIPHLSNNAGAVADTVCMQAVSDSGHRFAVYISSDAAEEYASANGTEATTPCVTAGQDAAHTFSVDGFPAVP